MKGGKSVTFTKPLLETPYPIDNIEVSLVIPAFNEANRLPKALEQAIRYFKDKFKFEVVIISDGSSDNTWGVIQNMMKKYNDTEIIGINYTKNAGKGHAVTSGMKYTRGQYILMLDADGATDINDYEKLLESLESSKINDLGIAIGSRRHLDKGVTTEVLIFKLACMA